ncbi:MAG: apolipoprotein N-acyltransferase [Acidobacteriota bacterium]
MKKLLTFKPDTKQNLLLAALSGVLLGFAYPPFPFGVLACVGFVPFLLLLERLPGVGRMLRYSYLTFFIFCVISLYWVGGFTHLRDPYLMMAGGILLIWQPVYFTAAAWVFVFIRKRFGTVRGVWALPFVWVTFEWLYALTELSFPWLTIGNTQTYYLTTIQFIEITGVYGLSFWILLLNVIAYLLVKRAMEEGSSKRLIVPALAFAALFLLPNLYGWTVDRGRIMHSEAKPITVGIVQPNIDPWDKWEGSATFAGRWRQTERYLEMVRLQKADSVDISILPESAILFNLPTSGEYFQSVESTLDSLGIGLISGYTAMHIYTPGTEPPSSSTFRGSTVHYDAYNAVLYLQPHNPLVQTYSKMRLVPFAERIPYADEVPFLIEPLRWGVGISNWGKGKDSTVFTDERSHAKFLAMICYESIYPDYVRRYVKKGAEFLVFITNDSWWGNTSGARQHNQYAVLRAIENRRWVARCANGGISSFIDPWGTMYDATNMYTEASIQHRIVPRTELTFYAKHGDWLAQIIAAVCALLLCAAEAARFLRRATV